MNAPLLPARQTFRQTVAEVAAKAKGILPAAVNGRIESAVKLVLALDVTPHEDGTIEVGSSTDPLKTYRLVGATCTCQDFARGQAPEGWCQHRIAAGIAKRVQELLPLSPVVETEALVAMTAQEPRNAAAADAQAPTVPLPEAPVSANCHITIAGRQVQLTLRGASEDEVLLRLERVLSRYPAPQPPAQAASPEAGWCVVHNVQMKEHSNAKGTWYSHYFEGAHCKGRRGRS